jgi:FG-GAP-like repeat
MKRAYALCIYLLLASAHVLAQSNPIPLIVQPLIPASVAPGSNGFILTVNGSGFGPSAAVYWNGSIRNTTVLSKSSVQAQISAADVANVGTAWITAANPGGGFSDVVYFPIRESALGLGFLQNTIATSSYSGPVVVGDFNNDGKLDVAIASENGGTIDIFLGRGDGTFQSPIMTPLKIGVIRMVAGDFNGDGNLDLAALQYSNGYHISVFLGKGNGKFAKKKSFSGPSHSTFMSVVDINGDGNLDLYVAGSGKYDGAFFDILYGNGDGTFRSGTGANFVCGGELPTFADFNGDGLMDVAAIDDCDGVLVFLNNGTGFQSQSYQVNTFGGTHLAAVDVNGDGKVDLVTDGVSVLLGNGDGTFKDNGGVKSDGGKVSINVGDFNGDGKLDIAAGASILLGNGDGTFQNPLAFAGIFPSPQFEMGDFNGDGKLDLLGFDLSSMLSFFKQVRVYLTPVSLGFGNQNIGTTSPPQLGTLTNFNGNTLTIKRINITGSNFKDFAQTNNCGSSLPPNGSCQIQVTFTPSFAGSENAELDVTYLRAGTLKMPLSGIGIQGVNTVSLTPSSLTYPTQLVGTTSSPQTATLTNTGNQPVTISSIVASAPFSQTNNCPSTLAPNGSCQIQTVFSPTGPGRPTEHFQSLTMRKAVHKLLRCPA